MNLHASNKSSTPRMHVIYVAYSLLCMHGHTQPIASTKQGRYNRDAERQEF